MAIRNDFEDFQLDVFQTGIYDWKGFTVNVKWRDKTIQRAQRPGESLTMLAILFVKGKERYMLATIPVELWPKRIYVLSNHCCCMPMEICNTSNVKYLYNNTVEKTVSDVHSDNCRECTLRQLVLEFMKDVYSGNVLPRGTHNFFDTLISILGGVEQVVADAPIVEEVVEETSIEEPEEVDPNFYSVQKSDNSYELHFIKNGKQCKRTLKCTSEKAEATLQGLRDLEAGCGTIDKAALRIWKPVTNETKVYQELFDMSQQENAELKEEIERLKKENSILETKCQMLSGNLASRQATGSIDTSGVNEIYQNEAVYQILNTLQEYVQGRGNASRRCQVLNQILEDNEVPDVYATYKQLFDRALAVGVSPKKREQLLRSIGYEQKNLGNCHYSVYPEGHEDLNSVVASTPSDFRTMKNTISDLLGKLFD